jgi:hypothetical protein
MIPDATYDEIARVLVTEAERLEREAEREESKATAS